MMSQDYKFVCWDCFRGIERNRPTTGFSRATGLPVSNVWKVRRICAVRKSATSAKGRRPSVARHYASFRLEPSALYLLNVVLIDDVITRGRTLLAAAARVREANPGAQIRAFALLRTMGLTAGVESLLAPCRGEIRWVGGDAQRIP